MRSTLLLRAAVKRERQSQLRKSLTTRSQWNDINEKKTPNIIISLKFTITFFICEFLTTFRKAEKSDPRIKFNCFDRSKTTNHNVSDMLNLMEAMILQSCYTKCHHFLKFELPLRKFHFLDLKNWFGSEQIDRKPSRIHSKYENLQCRGKLEDSGVWSSKFVKSLK